LTGTDHQVASRQQPTQAPLARFAAAIAAKMASRRLPVARAVPTQNLPQP
jgi:hypothetical protein